MLCIWNIATRSAKLDAAALLGVFGSTLRRPEQTVCPGRSLSAFSAFSFFASNGK
jgi:hypothetical protein